MKCLIPIFGFHNHPLRTSFPSPPNDALHAVSDISDPRAFKQKTWSESARFAGHCFREKCQLYVCQALALVEISRVPTNPLFSTPDTSKCSWEFKKKTNYVLDSFTFWNLQIAKTSTKHTRAGKWSASIWSILEYLECGINIFEKHEMEILQF